MFVQEENVYSNNVLNLL